MINPQSSRKKRAKAQRLLKFKKLKIEDLDLNEWEEMIASEIIVPDDIRECFADLGGHEDIIQLVTDSILLPLCEPQLFASSTLVSAPKGVLLYGPPGVGKTMIAKCIAKEAKVSFLNIRGSAILDKYVGETEKTVNAIFSLAKKIQPCIVFIDEIDALLKSREKTSSLEIYSHMKAEMMTLWDGLLSGGDRILILGATNRPKDIDEAFLRRMTVKIKVDLPTANQRRDILEKFLRNENLAPEFSLDKIVNSTDGYSGSDLKELCRSAVMVPLHERIRKKDENIRPICVSDFIIHMKRVEKMKSDLTVELDAMAEIINSFTK